LIRAGVADAKDIRPGPADKRGVPCRSGILRRPAAGMSGVRLLKDPAPFAGLRPDRRGSAPASAGCIAGLLPARPLRLSGTVSRPPDILG